MKKIVLFKSYENHVNAKNEEVCLTFLTIRGRVWRLIPLLFRAYRRIKKQFPRVKFHSLNLILDSKRVHFFDVRMSLVPLFELKELCAKLEKNMFGFRKADIDVYMANKWSGPFFKLSRNYCLM